MQVIDDVGALLRIGLAGEGHFRAAHEGLRTGEEMVEILEGPVAALGLHAVGIAKARDRALGTIDDAEKIGTDLGAGALLEIVAGLAGLGAGLALRNVGLGEPLGDRRDRRRRSGGAFAARRRRGTGRS